MDVATTNAAVGKRQYLSVVVDYSNVGVPYMNLEMEGDATVGDLFGVVGVNNTDGAMLQLVGMEGVYFERETRIKRVLLLRLLQDLGVRPVLRVVPSVEKALLEGRAARLKTEEIGLAHLRYKVGALLQQRMVHVMDDEECDLFRGACAALRLRRLPQTAWEALCGLQFMDWEPVASRGDDEKMVISLEVGVGFPPEWAPVRKLLMVPLTMTTQELCETGFEKLQRLVNLGQHGEVFNKYGVEDFILQVQGMREFLISKEEPLHRYDCVQVAFRNRQKLNLCFVLKEAALQDVQPDNNDASSSSSSFQAAVSLADRMVCQQQPRPPIVDHVEDFEVVESPLRVGVCVVAGSWDEKVTTYTWEEALIFARVCLMEGSVLIEERFTRLMPYFVLGAGADASDMVEFEYQSFPGALVRISVYVRPSGGEAGQQVTGLIVDLDCELGRANVALWSSRGVFRRGTQVIGLWNAANPRTPLYQAPTFPCVSNRAETTVRISVTLDADQVVVRCPVVGPPPAPAEALDLPPVVTNFSTRRTSIFQPTTPEEKAHLWACSHLLAASGERQHTALLPEVILSAPRERRAELYALLEVWPVAHLGMAAALRLVGHEFSDPRARAMGVRALRLLSDGELVHVMVQLVNALSFEAHHCSPLALFLLERALQNTRRVGHSFFWQLKMSVLHIPHLEERCTLLIDAYARGCGGHLEELEKQVAAMASIQRAHAEFRSWRKDTTGGGASKIPADDPRRVLLCILGPLKLPPRFVIPFDTRRVVGALAIEKCKYIDSKRVPLWLVFEDNLTVMFRGDWDGGPNEVFTKQLLDHMDRMWKEEANLDLGLVTYSSCVVARNCTLLQVVPNSRTLASIQKEMGGFRSAFSKTVIADWFRGGQSVRKQRCTLAAQTLLGIHRYGRFNFQRNGRDVIRKIARMILGSWARVEWENPDVAAKSQVFSRSLSGVCVATYVLGIGDRHNDNVLVRRSGEFFQVEFDFLFGHFRSKFGIKRERAPFVLTPAMKDFVGTAPEDWDPFVERCQRAYNILRRNAPLMAVLCLLPVASGGYFDTFDMTDVVYLCDSLLLNEQDDSKAAQHFSKLINEVLRASAPRVSTWFD